MAQYKFSHRQDYAPLNGQKIDDGRYNHEDTAYKPSAFVVTESLDDNGNDDHYMRGMKNKDQVSGLAGFFAILHLPSAVYMLQRIERCVIQR